ncbi:MAG TPA: hypothetical protein PJ994_02045 [Tepidiformaceae bacterium]|nr:hypothetical protein [Tepidiformaceae bacterium]
MTSPVSSLHVIAAYQPALVRGDPVGHGLPAQRDSQPVDTVVISEAARKLAEKARPDVILWGEVRYDPPHHDDPDFPWEIQHKEWMEVVEKVFARPETTGTGGAAA